MTDSVKIGPQGFAMNPCNALNLNHSICRDALPLGNGAGSDLEMLSDFGVEPALRADEVDCVHAPRLALLSAEVKHKRKKALSAIERFSGEVQIMDIGDLIKQQRMERGLSQKRLAELLGVNKSAVAQWETNATRPTEENMSAIKLVLGIHAGPQAAPGSPYRGKLVEDPDLLAWVEWLEKLDKRDRLVVARFVMGHTKLGG